MGFETIVMQAELKFCLDSLRNNGWRPIVLTEEKRPYRARGWQHWCLREQTQAEFEYVSALGVEYIERYAKLPLVGVAAHQGFLWVDIDIEELLPGGGDLAAIVARGMSAHLIDNGALSPLTRYGKRPRLVMGFRTRGTLGSVKVHPIEMFLGSGQVVVWGTHPGTGKPYEWLNPNQNPMLMRADAKEIPLVESVEGIRTSILEAFALIEGNAPDYAATLRNSVNSIQGSRVLGLLANTKAAHAKLAARERRETKAKPLGAGWKATLFPTLAKSAGLVIESKYNDKIDIVCPYAKIGDHPRGGRSSTSILRCDDPVMGYEKTPHEVFSGAARPDTGRLVCQHSTCFGRSAFEFVETLLGLANPVDMERIVALMGNGLYEYIPEECVGFYQKEESDQCQLH